MLLDLNAPMRMSLTILKHENENQESSQGYVELAVNFEEVT